MDAGKPTVFNTTKTHLRRWPWLYRVLINTIAPACFVGLSEKRFLKRFSEDQFVANIGSGIHKYGSNVVNFDIHPYKGVDVVMDAENLALANESLDGVLCMCLLEHVPRPERVVQEILRVLRPGGEAYITVPFVYPFHACPDDFYRWSEPGLRILLRDASIQKVAPLTGPTSALMAQLVTWTAITLSFGSQTLYHILSNLFLLVFFPIKFLDYVVGRFPTAIHGTAAWYAVIRKAGGS